ncbi:MAG: 4-alpha-glucanotransferase [Oscillospiraceae bacterium]|nr:4-alpha-glucanotransferase [Oscillospiraceae bacterium]
MPTKRSSGLIMHLSSLPGQYGIGSLGEAAFYFIDFLADAGQSFWQMLPLLPPGGGNSPYQSYSSFAGNPFFIDLDLLWKDGLLTGEECRMSRQGSPDQADFAFLKETRLLLLRNAFQRVQNRHREELDAFREEHKDWLLDYALFMALKDYFKGVPLSRWPDTEIQHRTKEAMQRYTKLLAEEISFYIFLQFLFSLQWKAVKDYAHRSGIQIIGDLPIYVSPDSADVWANPSLFQLKSNLSPQYTAGVPADSFSPTGQNWGNPLYDWEAHKKDGYAFWLARIRRNLTYYDLIRLDHFRGFHSYFAIPAHLPDASRGHWMAGPGMEFVRMVLQRVSLNRFIAEDLGELSEAARIFVAGSGLPGMRVLVDAFHPDGTSSFLPHNIPPHAVAYTSTHDTPTFVEWLFKRATPEERRFAMDYLRLGEDEGYGWGAVRGVWASPAALSISPLQDILGLGDDARMNTPATVGGSNWGWRVRREALNGEVSRRLRHLTKTYARM